MNAGDLRDLGILIVVTIVPTLLLVWLLARKRPGWRAATRAALAAAPIPLLVAILCAAIFARAAMAPREACGIDACGMAMAAAMVIGGFAVAAYAVGLLVALLAERLLAR